MPSSEEISALRKHPRSFPNRNSPFLNLVSPVPQRNATPDGGVDQERRLRVLRSAGPVRRHPRLHPAGQRRHATRDPVLGPGPVAPTSPVCDRRDSLACGAVTWLVRTGPCCQPAFKCSGPDGARRPSRSKCRVSKASGVREMTESTPAVSVRTCARPWGNGGHRVGLAGRPVALRGLAGT